VKAERALVGQWVEIGWVALDVGERADNIPEATRVVPLRARVKGFAQEAGEVGQLVTIITLAGRTLRGELLHINPAHTHSFGEPQPELLCIGPSLRREVE
jgi:hypothetical protein